jgi:integrase
MDHGPGEHPERLPTAGLPPRRPGAAARSMWPCGDRCECTERPRPGGHAALSTFPWQRSRRCAWTDSQAGERPVAGEWQDTGLVFTTHLGAAPDAGNVRKMFKQICTEAGIGDGWTPRELRTSFVSFMSHPGVSIEEIARLVGHASTDKRARLPAGAAAGDHHRRRDHG